MDCTVYIYVCVCVCIMSAYECVGVCFPAAPQGEGVSEEMIRINQRNVALVPHTATVTLQLRDSQLQPPLNICRL